MLLKNMKLFIVTDIFGETDHTHQLIKDLSIDNISIEIVAPYDDRKKEFLNENEAYASFVEEMGMESYINKVLQSTNNDSFSNKSILGFSVGASAVWAASDGFSQPNNIKKCICFYSSQIRDYLNVVPKMEIDLYFAKNEPKYSVSETISNLSENRTVNCFRTIHPHGFMNKCSNNFDQNGYNNYLKILKNSITRRFTGLAEARR